MDGEGKKSGFVWFLLIASVIYVFSLRSDREELSARVSELTDRVAEVEQEKERYKEALQEANEKIANAKLYEGGDYEDMSSVLADLEEVDEP